MCIQQTKIIKIYPLKTAQMQFLKEKKKHNELLNDQNLDDLSSTQKNTALFLILTSNRLAFNFFHFCYISYQFLLFIESRAFHVNQLVQEANIFLSLQHLNTTDNVYARKYNGVNRQWKYFFLFSLHPIRLGY